MRQVIALFPHVIESHHDGDELVRYSFECTDHANLPREDCSVCLAANEVRKQHESAHEQNQLYLGLKEELRTIFNTEEFSRINEKRCNVWHTGPAWDEMDWAGCIAGEAGEAQGYGKKLRRLLQGMIQKQVIEEAEQLLENYGKELADVVIYADLAATKAGFNLWDLVKKKFNETSERNGFKERL